MDLSKVRKLLRVCELIAQMPSGAGWVKPSEIILWSSVSQATTYRYLAKLEKLGYVQVDKRGYRSGFVNHYKITPNGVTYLKSFQEIL